MTNRDHVAFLIKQQFSVLFLFEKKDSKILLVYPVVSILISRQNMVILQIFRSWKIKIFSFNQKRFPPAGFWQSQFEYFCFRKIYKEYYCFTQGAKTELSLPLMYLQLLVCTVIFRFWAIKMNFRTKNGPKVTKNRRLDFAVSNVRAV